MASSVATRPAGAPWVIWPPVRTRVVSGWGRLPGVGGKGRGDGARTGGRGPLRRDPVCRGRPGGRGGTDRGLGGPGGRPGAGRSRSGQVRVSADRGARRGLHLLPELLVRLADGAVCRRHRDRHAPAGGVPGRGRRAVRWELRRRHLQPGDRNGPLHPVLAPAGGHDRADRRSRPTSRQAPLQARPPRTRRP